MNKSMLPMPKRKEMLDWIMECEWLDREQIEELTDEQLAKGIERHYDGGLAQFIEDGELKAIY